MLSAKDEQLLRSKQPLFHVWYLEDTIGEGSSGTVYRITDNNGNHCALKVIPITINNEADTFHLKKQDCVSKRKYLDEMTHEILAEVRVCKKLNHHAGIVNYQEYDVIEESDSFVRLILIRMDLLLPLNKLLRTKESEFSSKEVAAMGIDLLTSLSECRKHNIIHRDIKPSNIFVTSDGRYLLGDFGSARLLEKTMMASHKGTLAYMAPEIAAGQSFNSTVDIYSLGITMYQLLNNRRLPFLNDSFKFSDLESAVEKRLSGALLPFPENADRELGKIICKMCAHSPKNRYVAPEECLDDLKNYLNHNGESRKTKKRFRLSIIYLLLFMFLPVSALAIVLIPKTGHDLDIGILSGNVNLSGAIACDENWLYYSQDVPGERGIRVSRDGTQKEVLCDYTMHDINITDDYLFFSSQCTMNGSDLASGFTTGLYRMDKDGGNLICLDDASILNPVVYDKSVYYLKDEGDHKALCRIPVEGGKSEILSVFDKYTDNFYPYKDKLYIGDHAKNQLISLDIHNGTKAVIIDNFISRFCIEDGLLYVTAIELEDAEEDIEDNISYTNQIYVHEIDALPPGGVQANDSNSTVITFPYKVCEFNVSNGVIYASTYQTASEDNKPDKDGIWCVKNDGSSLKQIYTGNPMNLQIIDQKLYFSEGDTFYMNLKNKLDDAFLYSFGYHFLEGNTFYMDLNGTSVNRLDDMTLFYAFD